MAPKHVDRRQHEIRSAAAKARSLLRRGGIEGNRHPERPQGDGAQDHGAVLGRGLGEGIEQRVYALLHRDLVGRAGDGVGEAVLAHWVRRPFYHLAVDDRARDADRLDAFPPRLRKKQPPEVFPGRLRPSSGDADLQSLGGRLCASDEELPIARRADLIVR